MASSLIIASCIGLIFTLVIAVLILYFYNKHWAYFHTVIVECGEKKNTLDLRKIFKEMTGERLRISPKDFRYKFSARKTREQLFPSHFAELYTIEVRPGEKEYRASIVLQESIDDLVLKIYSGGHQHHFHIWGSTVDT